MLLTVSVIATGTLLDPPNTESEALYVPGLRPVGSAETVTLAGVEPLALL